MFKHLMIRLRTLASGEGGRFLLLGLLLAFLLSPGNLFVDAEKRLQVSRWMWTDEPQVLASDSQFLNHLPGRNGQTMAQFGVGQSLVMLPADMVAGALFGIEMTPQEMKLREMVVYYLTFPLISGLALAFARKLAGGFLDDPRRADLATLAFALGTSFLVYSRDTQENMLMNLCVLAGLRYGLLWSRGGLRWHAATMAAFFGFLILVRISTAAVIFPLTVAIGLAALPVLWRDRRRELFAGIAIVGAIYGAFVLLDRAYHWHRFGEYTRTYAYYMIEQAKLHGYGNNYPMGHSFWSGMHGFFLDPRKAAFLFDPLLFIAAAMLFLPLRNSYLLKCLIVASFAALLFTACLYARSDFWHGDTSWGPRHLHVAIVPTLLFGIIAAVSFLGARARSPLRPAFLVLLTAGFSVQALSLPLYQELEIEQWKAGYPAAFPPALRVRNLVATAKGDPDLWNLDCDNERVPVIQALPLQFVPFQIAQKMPGSPLAKLLIAGWALALAGFLAGLALWIRRLFRAAALESIGTPVP
jgi:hypothetical protein